ncbi:nucleoid-associated protein [Pseudomonas simiae]|uniref:nucleoid-associated protein n=1 Tax=Pseudomonas simiae TaxID=321846 RepID=UPI001967B675|nr:nucleoid-associated protein [Pseudomonas simiae]QRR30902.1 nucleoid-associated protein [Pseudomonas simiae]
MRTVEKGIVENSESESDAVEVAGGLLVINAQTADIYKKTLSGLTFYEAKIGKSWDLTKTTAQEFVTVIERKFARNNKFHGFFSPQSLHMAPITLSEYISQRIDFDAMVKAFVDSACNVANEPGRGALSLGHLVIVHYRTAAEEDDTGRVLAVLVGKKEGFDFDADLQPVDLSSINTSELRHAAMFDLTLFKEIYPKNDGEAYLKFIVGKSRSSFFKEAFGCGDHVPNKDSVEQVNKAVLDFLGSSELGRKQKLIIIESVTEHMALAAKHQKAITIDEIEVIINKKLPVESDKIGKFKEFVNLGGYVVSERFQPTRNDAVALKTIDINDPIGNFRCHVSLESIGYLSAGTSKPVKVDDDLQFITMPLTPEARAAIKQILGETDDPEQ